MVYKNNLSISNLSEIHTYLSHFELPYIESIKIFCLHVTSERSHVE